MELIVVRHGESEGNLAGRLQGRTESPLSERGREQAAILGRWLRQQGMKWHAAYASPLARAWETAQIVAEHSGYAAAQAEPDLREIAAGELEGLSREEMVERHPAVMERPITDLGDFARFGGESYDDVQARIGRLVARLRARHHEGQERVLLVAHGGLNFQLVKSVICTPVPRVAILRWGNCTATHLRFRERRGVYMAEVHWHVPVELMGGRGGEGSSGIFR